MVQGTGFWNQCQLRALAHGLLLAASVLLAGIVPASAGTAQPEISTDIVPGLGTALVQSTVQYLDTAVPPEQSGATLGMLDQLTAFPPAAEPIFADLVGMFGKQGLGFYRTGSYNNRNYGYRSSAPLDEPGALARTSGYEVMENLYTSPLVLDLSGGNPDALSSAATPHPYAFNLASATLFDIDGDGFVDFTEWVPPTMGILVDGRGLPPDGRLTGLNLIGTAGGWRNGFEHLAVFDADADGWVAGGELDPLLVWQDKDGDGTAQVDELYTTGQLGITGLSVPANGNQGVFLRSGAAGGPVWDVWPSYLVLRPRLTFSVEAHPEYWTPITIDGSLVAVGSADLTGQIPHGPDDDPVFVATAQLQSYGFNARESLLACLDPAGRHMAIVDHAIEAPHVSRVWIFQNNETDLDFVRCVIPEDSIDTTTFDPSGYLLLVAARQRTRFYIVSGWESGSTTVSRIDWTSPGVGFRGLWGSAFIDPFAPTLPGSHFHIPGYFYTTADGAPLCDAVAHLWINMDMASLSAEADIHALAGDHLNALDFVRDKPIAYFLGAPGLSFAVIREAIGDNVALLALRAGEPGTESVQVVDSAANISMVSAVMSRVEYLAQRDDDVWEVCWADVASKTGEKRSVPVFGRPSYPEIADSGTKLLWARFDWAHHATEFYTLDVGTPGATPQLLLSTLDTPGPFRVADAAPVYAFQTSAGIGIGGIPGYVEGPCVNNPFDCPQPRGGLYEVGDYLCLSVPCPLAPGMTFVWTKDDLPLVDDGRISGSFERTLRISVLTLEDTGVYRCLYGDGTKETQVFSAYVVVGEEVPAASLPLLGLLSAVIGLGGGALLRRKR